MVATLILGVATAVGGTVLSSIIAGTVLTWAAVAQAAIGSIISTGISYLLGKSKPNEPVGSAGRTARALLRQAVSPARYVLGRARAGGVLFYAFANGRTMHMAIGISEGDIEGISAFYANGEQIPTDAGVSGVTPAGGRTLVYHGTNDRGGDGFSNLDYEGRFKATCYLSSSTLAICQANGDSLRDAEGSEWMGSDVVPIAWVHLELTQGDAQPGELAQPWRSAQIPWEFQVDGMRLTWPGNTVPRWTDDAAAIRHWYDTTIRGRTVSDASFYAAQRICQETPPDEPTTIQLERHRVDLPLGEGREILVSLSGEPGRAVNVAVEGAPNDGVEVDGAPLALSDDLTLGHIRVRGTKKGLWRLTLSSPDANPTTMLVEVR